MYEYWAHTLEMEEAGYTFDRGDDYFRIDMFDCPSKGHLIKRGLAAYHDYCEHCMGWIKPVMDDAGFVINHEHNHAGQCWWEMRRATDRLDGPPPVTGPHDVRTAPETGRRSNMICFSTASGWKGSRTSRERRHRQFSSCAELSRGCPRCPANGLNEFSARGRLLDVGDRAGSERPVERIVAPVHGQDYNGAG